MSGGQLVALLLAATLVFWMVGAYNRLVALRNAVGAAWAVLDEVLQRRGENVAQSLAALRAPLADESDALDALLAAQSRVAAAADAMRAQPLTPPLPAALSAAEAVLAPAAVLVQALSESRSGVLAGAGAAAALQALRDAEPRVDIARQAFNASVAAYNAAVRQRPTRWLAQLYRFSEAQPL